MMKSKILKLHCLALNGLWSKWVSDRSERRVPSQRWCDMNKRWSDSESKTVLANKCWIPWKNEIFYEVFGIAILLFFGS